MLIKLRGNDSVLNTVQFNAFMSHSKTCPTNNASGEKKLITRRKIPPNKTKVDKGITNKLETKK